MVWCGGWRLAAAVSEAGGLGLIGAGSMHPEVLQEHIVKCKEATRKPFGVNVPLLYPEIERIMKIIIAEKVPVVFTSAGNPKTWTKTLKDEGIKVAHVVSSSKFAVKCQEAGNHHDGTHPSRTTSHRHTSNCCRRHSHRRCYAGCLCVGSRRGTDRHTVCTYRRKFGKRRIQAVVCEPKRGRHYACSEENRCYSVD